MFRVPGGEKKLGDSSDWLLYLLVLRENRKISILTILVVLKRDYFFLEYESNTYFGVPNFVYAHKFYFGKLKVLLGKVNLF